MQITTFNKIKIRVNSGEKYFSDILKWDDFLSAYIHYLKNVFFMINYSPYRCSAVARCLLLGLHLSNSSSTRVRGARPGARVPESENHTTYISLNGTPDVAGESNRIDSKSPKCDVSVRVSDDRTYQLRRDCLKTEGISPKRRWGFD